MADLRKKYNRIPIILSSDLPIANKKILVPPDMTFSQLLYMIRQRLKIDPKIGIYLLIDNVHPCGTSMISEYDYLSIDDILYVNIQQDTMFGSM